MSAPSGVLLVATMDTKGEEAAFLQAKLQEADVPVMIMDAGIMGEAVGEVDITRREIAQAGGHDIDQVRAVGHEGKALNMMIEGAKIKALELFDQGRVTGILGLGGSMGTTLGTAVMRLFGVGVPKVMISTMASRDTHAFVGTKDIMMLHAVCDLSGLNRITRRVLANGAMAMAGMVTGAQDVPDESRPLVALSTLGTTETCAQAVRAALEQEGYEVTVFHTVGAGGQAMDELIADGQVDGVVDLSLHELADHVFGGDYDAGPERGQSALKRKLPCVLVPGNVDFLVTGPMHQAETRFPGRQYHAHNAAITVVKSTPEEMAGMGERMAGLCALAEGPMVCLVPTGGLSAFNSPGAPFDDPAGVDPLVNSLKKALPKGREVRVMDCHINAPEFSQAVTAAFKQMVADA